MSRRRETTIAVQVTLKVDVSGGTTDDLIAAATRKAYANIDESDGVSIEAARALVDRDALDRATGKPKNYGMYSADANALIHSLVVEPALREAERPNTSAANVRSRCAETVVAGLNGVSRVYPEAHDTEVRESVYAVVGDALIAKGYTQDRYNWDSDHWS